MDIPIDSKRILHEYTVKNSIIPPKYITEEMRKTPPMFCSECRIEGVSVTEGIGRTKKESERAAAHKMLSILSQPIKSIPVDTTDSNIYLVDGDNVNLSSTFGKKVILFLSKNSTTNKKLRNSPVEGLEIEIVNSGQRDAVDHYITFTLGKLVMKNPYQKYVVVTKDHFGEILEKFSENIKWITQLE